MPTPQLGPEIATDISIPTDGMAGTAIEQTRGKRVWATAPRFGSARLSWPPRAQNLTPTSKSRLWVGIAAVLLTVLALTWPGQRVLYPLHHRDWIVKYSRENKLQPSLVAALIRQESSFRVNARSPVGATGLMQLLPSTARWVTEHLEGREFSLDTLTSPEVNVRLGAHYLGHLRDRFGERPVLYLSAYNAGPRCVEEWLRRQDGPLTIKDIPFPETRAYVSAVLRGQVRYAYLYPQLDAMSGANAQTAPL